MNDSVIIPRREIEKLEKARQSICELSEQLNLSPMQLSQMQDVTGIMWRIAHRKWERVDLGKCPQCKGNTARCFDCKKLINLDDDALVCIECGGRNSRFVGCEHGRDLTEYCLECGRINGESEDG